MSTLKAKILELIDDCRNDIDEKNLDEIQIEYTRLIDKLSPQENFSPIINLKDEKLKTTSIKKDLWTRIGIKKDPDQEANKLFRLIVIGDIHCDFNSLTGIFLKLSISEYEYFDSAYFLFIGDYIDRGLLPLQTIRFLLNLKAILGERCIYLRGNHDQIKIDNDDKLYSEVKPAETVELFNEYLRAETRKKLKSFFSSLPYIATLKRSSKNILFVHGSIPRDDLAEDFNLNEFKKIKFSDQEDKSNKNIKLLNSMLWGDPTPVKFKMNGSSIRFEFGSEQFEKFMIKNNYTHLIRGHEPVNFGFREMYDKKLITLFSSGSSNNEQSYYNDSVSSPAFLIIDEKGDIHPESIFEYKLILKDDGSHKKEIETRKILISKKNDSIYTFSIEIEVDSSFKEFAVEKIRENIFLNQEFYINLTADKIPYFLIQDLFLNKNKEDQK